MKLINIIIGILIIFLGSTFMSITIFNEVFKTILLKVIGTVIVFAGIFYLRNIAKFGRQ